MKKRLFTLITVLALSISFTGCTNSGITHSKETSKHQEGSVISDIDDSSLNDVKDQSQSSESQDDVKTQTQFSETPDDSNPDLEPVYEPLTTFEYTNKMLEDMNKDNDDFDIIFEGSGRIIISGKINSSPVKNEEYVIEQLRLIRSILGLIDPKQQLVYLPDNSSEDHYVFQQYHGSLRLYGSVVSVNVDPETGLICYVDSAVTTEDILKKIKNTDILSKTEINEKYKNEYPGITADELILWNMNEYKDSPVPAYIANTDEIMYIINASDGKIIDNWSTIIE